MGTVFGVGYTLAFATSSVMSKYPIALAFMSIH